MNYFCTTFICRYKFTDFLAKPPRGFVKKFLVVQF